MVWRWLTPVVLLGVIGAGRLAAQEVDEAAVRLAAIRFTEAAVAGDEKALVSLLWVSENSASQRTGRTLLGELVGAEKRLEQAARQRYGDAGGRLRSGFESLFTPADRQALAEARVTGVEGGRGALVWLDRQVWPVRLRQSPEGQWQVVLEWIASDLHDEMPDGLPNPYAALVQIRLDRLRGMGAAVRETTRRIEAGELASVAAAEADLAGRLAETQREARRRWSRWRR